MVIHFISFTTMKEQTKSTMSFFILLTMAVLGLTTFVLNIIYFDGIFKFVGNEIACIVFIIASVTGVKNEYKSQK